MQSGQCLVEELIKHVNYNFMYFDPNLQQQKSFQATKNINALCISWGGGRCIKCM